MLFNRRRLGQAKRRPNTFKALLYRCWVIAPLDPTYMGGHDL
jgi:hypothetical protein